MSGSISPWPVVKSGSNGHPIKTLQYLLRARGHSIAVDGVFGPQTEASVKAFQAGDGSAADGTVGAATWAALVVQVKREMRFKGSKRNSSSATCLATLRKGRK
jgi:peptidoglycan hydrolase-like protein with peptidoglycan-binding domain